MGSDLNTTDLHHHGVLITLEGGEGVGKSTLCGFIAQWFRQRQRDALLTREPGGTQLGERLRELVLGGEVGVLDGEAELLIMLAARRQHLAEVIRPALQRGQVVICDRFNDASIAYQGAGRGLGIARVRQVIRATLGAFQPHLTLLLDCPVEVASARIARQGRPLDRIESEQREFFERVRGAYLELAVESPQRMVILDAAGSLESVQRQVAEILQQHFPSEQISPNGLRHANRA